MKTLAKFECSNCVIKVQMYTPEEMSKDNFSHCLYVVTTTPKQKNKWKEYKKHFAFTHEYNEYFLSELKYWLI